MSIAFNWFRDSSASSIDCSTTVFTVSADVVVCTAVVVGAAVVTEDVDEGAVDGASVVVGPADAVVGAWVLGASVVAGALVVGPISSMF